MPYKSKLVGIYKITNIVNDKIYVGQSIAIKQRWSQHKAELRKNKHGNCHLQKAWNKYGEENFKFSVLEYLDTDISKDFLTEREQYWIDYYDSSNKNLGYNICPLAATCLGKETSEQGRINIKKGLIQRWERADILDKVHISTLSQRMINKYGVGFYIQSNKLTEEEVLEIKQLILDNISDVDISQKYNVNVYIISSIRLGKTWTHLTGFTRKKRKFVHITKQTVMEIINLSNNYSNIEISKMLNISIDTVKNVTNGLTWNHLTGLTKNTKPKKSKVVQLDLNNNLLNTFSSQADAGKYLKLEKSKGICDCCRHRQNTAYGYKWMYYDEYNNL